jgi:hypothetical protein
LTEKELRDIRLKPPMPDYHLTHRDAEAVVAYLKSLVPVK